MTNITETSSFDASVPRVDTTDPVIGGLSGESNAAAIALANRTRFLYDHLQAFAGINTVTATGAITSARARDFIYCDISSNIVLTIDAISTFVNGQRLFFKCKCAAGMIKNVQILANGSEKIYRGSREFKIWLYDGEEICLVKNGTAWEVIHANGNFDLVGNDNMVRRMPPNSLIANGNTPESSGTLPTRADLARLWDIVGGSAIADSTWLSNAFNYRGFFSTGNGSTTLRVPDMRGMHLRGLDLSRNVSTGRVGSGAGGYEADQLMQHTHSLPNIWNEGGSGHFASGGNTNEGAPIENATGAAGTVTETRVKTIGLIPIIYY